MSLLINSLPHNPTFNLATFNLLSANVSNLDKSKTLSFGKELRCFPNMKNNPHIPKLPFDDNLTTY